MENTFLDQVHGKLIISCQALEGEPLHSSFIMARMARAAKMAGAPAIRANSIVDIQAIQDETGLPIIGIIKKDYPDSDVYITPTIKEVEDLINEGVQIIAIDATKRERPDRKDLKDFIAEIKEKYPNQLFMADISSVDEALYAEKIGFDIVGTTLVGYTDYTKNYKALEELEKVVKVVKIPVIAEGNIDTPLKAKKALEIGAFAVVVGGAITRPQQITKKFVDEMK